MQILKSTPAKIRDAQCLISWHNLSENYDIFQAYKSPSRKKQEAWEYCKDLCEERNGRNLKIIGKNCFSFSAGFFYTDENGKERFTHITKSNDYSYPIE
jgi:hypothetical protein